MKMNIDCQAFFGWHCESCCRDPCNPAGCTWTFMYIRSLNAPNLTKFGMPNHVSLHTVPFGAQLFQMPPNKSRHRTCNLHQLSHSINTSTTAQDLNNNLADVEHLFFFSAKFTRTVIERTLSIDDWVLSFDSSFCNGRGNLHCSGVCAICTVTRGREFYQPEAFSSSDPCKFGELTMQAVGE